MCVSSCGGLFEVGKPLDEVTCPCKCGYWDVWKVAFVDGDKIRAGQAPPREDYVRKVKEKLSPEEYESRIRVQGWIRHFLMCKTKRELDDRITREGKNDGSSIRKALTEWWEFEHGDYQSHGTSGTLDANTLADIWKRIRGFPVTRQEFGLLQAPAAPQRSVSRGRLPVPAAVSSQADISRHVATSDRSTAVTSIAGGGNALRDYFLPEERLRQDILTDHCGRGMFGPGATVRPFTHPVSHKVSSSIFKSLTPRQDGRRGFMIRGTIQPTTVR